MQEFQLLLGFIETILEQIFSKKCIKANSFEWRP